LKNPRCSVYNVFVARKNKFKISNFQAQRQILIQVRDTSQNINSANAVKMGNNALFRNTCYWSYIWPSTGRIIFWVLKYQNIPRKIRKYYKIPRNTMTYFYVFPFLEKLTFFVSCLTPREHLTARLIRQQIQTVMPFNLALFQFHLAVSGHACKSLLHSYLNSVLKMLRSTTKEWGFDFASLS
jgi:hypothetical protein